MATDQYEVFRTSLGRFSDLAQEATTAASRAAAIDLWSQAFKHFFPLPEHLSADLVQAAVDPRVLVHARRVRPVKGRRNEWSNVNRIGPIPIKCRIEFKLVNPGQLPRGAVVEWVVRNEGPAAEAANDLGHSRGTGLSAEEQSEYVGRHWMDCVVRLGTTVIGLRRVRVTIR